VKYVTPKLKSLPDKLPVLRMGTSVELHTTVELSAEFQITVKNAESMLRKLGVPTFSVGEHQFFSIHTLEQAMFISTELGAPGFASPGSKRKQITLPHQKSRNPHVPYHTDVTDIRDWYKKTGQTLKPDVALLKRMKMATEARMAKVGVNLKHLLQEGSVGKITSKVGQRLRAGPETSHQRNVPGREESPAILRQSGILGEAPEHPGVGTGG